MVLAREPDGVALGFAEFTAGDGVDDERSGPDIGGSVFETLDEMDAAGAVAILVGTAELEGDAIFTIEVEIIVTLDESVGKFGIGNAGAALADAFLDELAIEKLSHREDFADFAEEVEIFYVLKPIEII